MGTKRILIVDDDREFADGIAARCRSIGLDAETARNSLTAIGIVAVRPPDVICLDVEMPTGNGLNICEFLRADRSVAEKPVIILTGRTDVGTVRRCGEMKATYLHKSPNVWREMREVLNSLLDLDDEQSLPAVVTATNGIA